MGNLVFASATRPEGIRLTVRPEQLNRLHFRYSKLMNYYPTRAHPIRVQHGMLRLFLSGTKAQSPPPGGIHLGYSLELPAAAKAAVAKPGVAKPGKQCLSERSTEKGGGQAGIPLWRGHTGLSRCAVRMAADPLSNHVLQAAGRLTPESPRGMVPEYSMYH